ncbi:MAG: hypothetical protein ACRDRJ_08920 [Streptosporangiaceae bacterium]
MMADEDVLVVVPRSRAQEVLSVALALKIREAAIVAEVRSGTSLPEAMRDARLAGREVTA